jgi:hypothetical protein
VSGCTPVRLLPKINTLLYPPSLLYSPPIIELKFPLILLRDPAPIKE